MHRVSVKLLASNMTVYRTNISVSGQSPRGRRHIIYLQCFFIVFVFQEASFSGEFPLLASLFFNFRHLSWALAGCRETADVCRRNQTRRRCDNDLGRWIESIRKGSNWLSRSKLGWSLLLSRTTATISWFRNLAFFSVKRQFGSRLNAFARQSLVCSKRKPR